MIVLTESVNCQAFYQIAPTQPKQSEVATEKKRSKQKKNNECLSRLIFQMIWQINQNNNKIAIERVMHLPVGKRRMKISVGPRVRLCAGDSFSGVAGRKQRRLTSS